MVFADDAHHDAHAPDAFSSERSVCGMVFGALPHAPQGTCGPLTPFWRSEQTFFKPTTAPLGGARVRLFWRAGRLVFRIAFR